MNRWAARIVGVIMLLLFSMIFMQMYKTLKMMQNQSQPTQNEGRR